MHREDSFITCPPPVKSANSQGFNHLDSFLKRIFLSVFTGIFTSNADFVKKSINLSLRQRAFTMAEVLITLGIIGIVAALTIPQLIKNHEKRVLHTQFLKMYSDLNNAEKLFEAKENITVHEYSKNLGDPQAGTEEMESTYMLKLFMQYFNGQAGATGSMSNTEEGEYRKDVYKRMLGYIPAALNGSNTSSQPCDESIIMSDIAGRFFVMDNNLTGVVANAPNGPKICVDTNGKKGPNKYGYDWFVFTFTSKGTVIPYIGNSLTSYGADLEDPSTECSYSRNSATYTCGYYALSDTRPDGEGGTYWKDFLK